ncbi:MAG: hypothetical protein U1F54_02485 [Burkholderiales bacterium]
MTLRPLATVAACAVATYALASSALAQSVAPPPVPPDLKAQINERIRESLKGVPLDDRFLADLDEQLSGLPASPAFIANEFGHPREIVKNAPYTAEAISESVQTLPDGNRIVRKSTTLLARDTAGRTRQERKDGGRAGVYLYDPMDGRTIVLNERTRTAIPIPRAPSPPEPPMPPVGAVPPVPPVPPVGGPGGPGVAGSVDVQPGRVVVRRNRGPEGGGKGDDVQVEVVRVTRGDADGAMPPPPPLPPLTLPLLPRGKGETKSLGTREFDGIKAEGTMTTHTIPAGQIGNEKPIVVTSERWFSPDLFIVVYAKTSDPRAGETVYRVTNVKRGEPPADLFKVPADYRTRAEGRKAS